MKKYLDLIIFLTLLSYYILFSCTTLFGFWLFIAIRSLFVTFILALHYFYMEFYELSEGMDVSFILPSLLSTCIPAIIFFPVLFSIFDDNRTIFQDFNINKNCLLGISSDGAGADGMLAAKKWEVFGVSILAIC